MVYQRYRRAGRKIARAGRRWANRRYKTKTGGVRVAKLARDVAYVKRSLNVEHKQILTRWGTYSSTYGVVNPTGSIPYLSGWLTLPAQGTDNRSRIGNNIVITHISAKFQVDLSSTVAGQNKVPFKMFLLFVKAGINYNLLGTQLPANDLFNKDMNGQVSQSSYRNKDCYTNFIELKTLSTTRNPSFLVQEGGVGLSQHRFAWNAKCRIPIRFTTGDATGSNPQTNRPLLIMMSDVDGVNTITTIAADVKMTYIDN